jgi:iron uptake system component EfeO
MRRPVVPALLTALALPLVLAGCSKQEQPSAGAGTIAVQASDTECKLARAEADAGTITFEVANQGSKVTEFYLYGEGDRVLGEAEDIGPGTSRRLVVEVPQGGSYTAACKPGMTGNGIRVPFTVKAR